MTRTIEQEKATREAMTKASMLRIASLKIKAYKLSDTPEDYVRKCQEKAYKSKD